MLEGATSRRLWQHFYRHQCYRLSAQLLWGLLFARWWIQDMQSTPSKHRICALKSAEDFLLLHWGSSLPISLNVLKLAGIKSLFLDRKSIGSCYLSPKSLWRWKTKRIPYWIAELLRTASKFSELLRVLRPRHWSDFGSAPSSTGPSQLAIEWLGIRFVASSLWTSRKWPLCLSNFLFCANFVRKLWLMLYLTQSGRSPSLQNWAKTRQGQACQPFEALQWPPRCQESQSQLSQNAPLQSCRDRYWSFAFGRSSQHNYTVFVWSSILWFCPLLLHTLLEFCCCLLFKANLETIWKHRASLWRHFDSQLSGWLQWNLVELCCPICVLRSKSLGRSWKFPTRSGR